MKVTKRECAEVPLRIENEALVKLSAEDEKRHAQEREKMLEALAPEPRAAGFSLPLRTPAADLNGDGEGFCETRILNEATRTRHTGRDYRVARGTTVRAPARTASSRWPAPICSRATPSRSTTATGSRRCTSTSTISP